MIDEDQHGADPHALLFGGPAPGEVEAHHPAPVATLTRSALRHQRRRRRRGRRRTVAVTVLLVVAVVVGAVWFVARPLLSNPTAKDYPGTGEGSILVKVRPGEGANAIAQTLLDDGVIASTAAFTHAAGADKRFRLIQPGTYALRQHMSGASAVALMLDPSSRRVVSVSIPEGMTTFGIRVRLAKALAVPEAQVADAMKNLDQLGLPISYTTAGGKQPASVEGFLFPSTYSLDPGTSPLDALQQMIAQFTAHDRDLDFATAADAQKVSAYEALIIASMIEGEAKFDADRAKVARVVYNRLARQMPLGIDATSIYGAELAGSDPRAIDFDRPAPYNTRVTKGLPPTPIGNPGDASLKAAVAPAAGPWLYYVNDDAQGHLFFTASGTDFEKAAEKCRVMHWGCS